MSNNPWRRGARAPGARSLRLIVAASVMMIAAGGVIGLLNAAASPGEPPPRQLQPLTALGEAGDARTTDALAAIDPRPAAEPAVPQPADRDAAGNAPPAPRPDAAQTRPTPELPTFNGRPIRPAETLTMVVTAYSPDAASCAPYDDGITASGFSVYTHGGNLVAADTSVLPFGSILTIPGYNDGFPVPVLDRGGAIKGKRLDVLYPTHDRALQWGVQTLNVTVWEYADSE